MKFILLEGFHLENGVKYKKDDSFDSKKCLDKIFPNRFEKVKKIIEKDVINIAPDTKEDIQKQPKKKKAKKVK